MHFYYNKNLGSEKMGKLKEKQPIEETLKNKTEEAQEHKEKAKNKANQTKAKNEPEL